MRESVPKLPSLIEYNPGQAFDSELLTICMGNRTIGDLFGTGILLAGLFGLLVLFLVVDFSSPQGNTDTIGRFIVGMMSIIAPTSTFDVFVSFAVAITGGITVGRENVAAGFVAGVFLYGIVSFAIGWFTAPV